MPIAVRADRRSSHFFDILTGGPPPNPDVLADSATREGVKHHVRLSWDRVQELISDKARLEKAYDVPPDEYLDPPRHTGRYIAYHRLVHDIQHRGDVMRYLSLLGVELVRRRRPL